MAVISIPAANGNFGHKNAGWDTNDAVEDPHIEVESGKHAADHQQNMVMLRRRASRLSHRFRHPGMAKSERRGDSIRKRSW